MYCTKDLTMTKKKADNSLICGVRGIDYRIDTSMPEYEQLEELYKAMKAAEAANRAAKAKERKASEDAPLVDAVKALLSDHAVRTATQIRDAVEGIDSTSKATAICKRIDGITVSDVVVDKRIVKGYSL